MYQNVSVFKLLILFLKIRVFNKFRPLSFSTLTKPGFIGFRISQTNSLAMYPILTQISIQQGAEEYYSINGCY